MSATQGADSTPVPLNAPHPEGSRGKNGPGTLPFSDPGEDTPEMLREAVAQANRLPPPPIVIGTHRGQANRFTPETVPPTGSWTNYGPRHFHQDMTGGSTNDYISGRLNAVAYDPLNAGNYYVAAPWGGIWKYLNSTSTWSPKTDGASGLSVISFSSLAVDPVTSGIVFAGTGDVPNTGIYTQGLWKSTDGGSTWSQSGTFTAAVPQVVIDPDQHSTILASIQDQATGGIYRSTDGGSTWSSVLTGGKHYFQSIVYGPNSGGTRTFYASGEASNGALLYYSTNHGANWTPLTSPTSSNDQYRLALAASPTNAGHVYLLSTTDGKVWGSTNSGGTWSDVTGSLAGLTCQPSYTWMLGCAVYGTTDVLIVGECNAWYSVGANGTWTGLPQNHSDHHGIAVNPSQPSEFLTVNDGGVDRFTYNGSMSRTALSKTLVVSEFWGIAYDSSDPNVILGATQDTGMPFTSDTGEQTWLSAQGMVDGNGAAINQSSPGTQYAAVGWNLGSTQMSVRRTTNYWSSANFITPMFLQGEWGGNYSTMVLDPNNQSLMYIATEYLYRWNESTQMWSLRLGGQNLGSAVNGVAIAPTDSNRIYTVSGDGYIYMTTNGGSSWTQINGNLPTTCPGGACNLNSVAVASDNENLVLVGYAHTSPVSGSGRMWKCTNPTGNPPTWTDVSAYGQTYALPNNAVLSIATDWKYPDTDWWVGTDIGVFYTADSGADWTSANQFGMPNVPVTNVKCTATPTSNNLCAATQGRGIYCINDYCSTPDTWNGTCCAPSCTNGYSCNCGECKPTCTHGWSDTCCSCKAACTFGWSENCCRCKTGCSSGYYWEDSCCTCCPNGNICCSKPPP